MTAAPRDPKGVFPDDLPIRPSAWMLALAAGLSLVVVTFALAMSSRQGDVARGRPITMPTNGASAPHLDTQRTDTHKIQEVDAGRKDVRQAAVIPTQPPQTNFPVELNPARVEPTMSSRPLHTVNAVAPRVAAPVKSVPPKVDKPSSTPIPSLPAAPSLAPCGVGGTSSQCPASPPPAPIKTPSAAPTPIIPAPTSARSVATVSQCSFDASSGLMSMTVDVVGPADAAFILSVQMGDLVQTTRSGRGSQTFHFSDSRYSSVQTCTAYALN